MTKQLEMKVTICRGSDDVIRIHVRDPLSRQRFLSLQMAPHDFCMALTGMAEVDVSGEVYGLDRVGLRRITEARHVKCPPDLDRKGLEQWLLDACQEDGWIVDSYLGSQGSVTGMGDGRTAHYSVYRFVEAL